MTTSSARARQAIGPAWRRVVRRLGLLVVLALPGSTAGLTAATVGVVRPATTPAAANLIVAPTGRAGNPGTAQRPLDLGTALSQGSPARPGDTIWLRGGTYRGAFETHLSGSATRPIIVRQVPGERAVIDGGSAEAQTPTLTVRGAYAWYWGFEVTNSDPDRSRRGTGVQVYGPHTRFIDLVVHGTGNGFGVWADALEAELYGNLIFDNGWDSADRGHGHSIYVQNQTGVKRIVDNILFDSFSFGIHGYTEKGYIDNLHIEGNIAFNHGVPSKVSGAKANIMVGGYRTAQNAVVLSNYTYYPGASAGRNADLGYIVGCSDFKVANNYLVGGVPLLLTACRNVEVKDNTLFAPRKTGLSTQFPGNTVLTAPPAEPTVIVRANRYEPGRAHVAVYNWRRQAAVTVPLAGAGLTRGAAFEIRDAQDYFGAPLLRGTFSGASVRLPMRAAKQTGALPGATAPVPEFGAFVIVTRAPARDRAASFVAHLSSAGQTPRH